MKMVVYSFSVIVAVVLAAGSALLIIGYLTDTARIDTLFVLGDNFFIAAAALTCVWALLRRDSDPSGLQSVQSESPSQSAGWLDVLIVVVHVGGVILRLIAPGTSVLTWVVVPLWIFVVPGLAFARLLMPHRSVIEQFMFAPPLSIGLQVIGVMWLTWLHIPITIPVLLALNGTLTLVGLLVALRASTVQTAPDSAPP